jgi:hypothetical protein
MNRSLNGLLKFTEQSIFVDTRQRNKIKIVRRQEKFAKKNNACVIREEGSRK